MTNEHVLAQCSGKRQFDSYRQVTSQLKLQKVRARKKNYRIRLTPYKCPHCRRWHLGSPD